MYLSIISFICASIQETKASLQDCSSCFKLLACVDTETFLLVADDVVTALFLEVVEAAALFVEVDVLAALLVLEDGLFFFVEEDVLVDFFVAEKAISIQGTETPTTTRPKINIFLKTFLNIFILTLSSLETDSLNHFGLHLQQN